LVARRRIPAAAFEERKKRLGTASSKTSDKEHSTTSLGDSEESTVQHSPGHAIPEVGQRREYDGEISATVRGKKSGDVLNDEPAGPNSVGDACELEEQRRALAGEARSPPRDRDVLTGEASADEVNTSVAVLGP
jgi:hypothetical protein